VNFLGKRRATTASGGRNISCKRFGIKPTGSSEEGSNCFFLKCEKTRMVRLTGGREETLLKAWRHFQKRGEA